MGRFRVSFLLGAIILQFWTVHTEYSQESLEKLDEWWGIFSTSWPRYEETTEIIHQMEEFFPDHVKIYSIGKSVQDREQNVIKLSQNVTGERPLLDTPIKLVANMHGDEALGRALLLLLTVDILTKYTGGDERATQLLDNTELHLLYSMNPDGYEAIPEGSCDPDTEALGRVNANLEDLNRDFPDHFVSQGMSFASMLENRQPETVNVMKWITSNYFVLSANLHALTVVASYPFDSVPIELENDPKYEGEGVISRAPDHDVLFALATLYADNHGTMAKGNDCPEEGEFKKGVTNGAEWYNVRGGMQDFNYINTNTFELTFELSCCKFPPADTLLTEWDNNKESLWKYVEASHWGIMGIVNDESGKPIEDARIHVEGIDHFVRTTPRGEYWRLLLPGTYKVWADGDGYQESAVESVVVENKKKVQLQQDFTLVKKTHGTNRR